MIYFCHMDHIITKYIFQSTLVLFIFLLLLISFTSVSVQGQSDGLLDPPEQTESTTNDESSENNGESNADTQPYVMGEILIQYKETVFNARTSELESDSIEVPGGLLDEPNTPGNVPVGVVNEFLKRNGVETPLVKSRIESLHAELVDIGDTDPLTIINQLKASPVEGITLAQPNFIYTSSQSSTSTTGPDPQGNKSWHLKAIQLKDAWNTVDANPHTNARTITIGVLDDGVDFANQDLDGRKWSKTNCKDEDGNTVTDNDDSTANDCANGGYDVYGGPVQIIDEFFHDNDPAHGTGDIHGTQVASVMAGEYNNGYGGIGIAQDGIEIVGIRIGETIDPLGDLVSDISLYTTTNIVEGIDFARENNIDIINMSFGGYDGLLLLGSIGCNLFKYASSIPATPNTEWIEYQALKKYKGLAITSTGNSSIQTGGGNHQVHFPSGFSSTTAHSGGEECWSGLDNVISVGGTELNSSGTEEIWVHDTATNKGTSYGNHIDVAAPAAKISTVSAITGNSVSYGVFNGNSLAAPQVAGVAALMLRVNPNLTPSDIKTKIRESADEIDNLRTNNLAEGRRLNAYRAVVAALGGKTKQLKTLPTIPSLSSNSDYLTVSKPAQPYEITSTPGNQQLTISWDPVPNADSYEIRWRAAGRDTTLTPWKNIGAVTEKIITGLTNGTRYVVQVRGVNSAGNGDKAVVGFNKSTTPKAVPLSAPTAAMATPGDGQLTISWDPVADVESYEIRWRSAGHNRPNPWNYTNVGNVLIYTITGLTNGTRYAIHLRAKNSAGVSEKIIINFGKRTKPAKLKPTGGTDSDGDGLIDIVTVEQLNNMRYNLYGTSYKTSASDAGITTGCPSSGCRGYELLNDLDFTGSRWVSGNGWTSIGGGHPGFAAEFEGNNHTISNLFVGEGATYGGLFGWLRSDTALVKNLTIKNASVKGRFGVGVLASGVIKFSDSSREVVFNVAVENSTISGNNRAGGLIGHVQIGIVNNSLVTGSTIIKREAGPFTGAVGASHQAGGGPSVGGFIGNLGGTVNKSSVVNSNIREDSSNHGYLGGFIGNIGGIVNKSSVINSTVVGDSLLNDRNINIGGFFGRTSQHGDIRDSYIVGSSVIGSEGDYVGGIIGQLDPLNDTTFVIKNVYSDVAITHGNGIYGHSGSDDNTLTITNSYYNKEKATATPLQPGAKTRTQLQSGIPSTTIYTDWSTDTWDFDTTTEFPTFR